MQTDGNLVLYSGKKATWATGTYGMGGTEVVMQNDGNLVIYGPQGAVWSSLLGFAQNTLSLGQSLGTNQFIISPDGAYRAILQSDGNFVVYGPNGATWATGTYGQKVTSVSVRNGSLTLSAGRRVSWFTSTARTGATQLVMQNDGNLVLYGPSGAVWSALYG
jgi:hypothetical protein